MKPLAALALCCACALSTPTAVAQPRRITESVNDGTDAQRREAARLHFEQGMRHVRERDWLGAVQELRLAAELRPTPAVFFNLGMALREAGRPREAIVALTAFQADPGPTPDPMRMQLVQAMLDALRASFARVTVEVAPREASVTVDGEAVHPGESLTLDPGEHTVRAQAEGYVTQSRAITLGPGQALPLVLQLAPARTTGTAAVESDVPDAAIELDGQPAGTGRVERELPVGTHVVVIRAPGHEVFQRSIEVTLGGRSVTHATLRPRSRPVLTSPWFWTAAGAVVAVATVSAVLLLSGPEAPVEGALGHVSDALRTR